ncbi:EscU/YscU/HrcU family type III secretion system export apparatus switch protein [Salinarimonas sp. NSM]|uniref:EscU/YscU/HrcU family type III secretion system export apparatus switch protein n=1 Tax=Salinarimonas sp. NSM TaxID=3458003 RepID=UPI00403570FF
MAGNNDDAEEATFDPTPQRLRQLREQGQVPRSQEVVDAITLLAVLAWVVFQREAYIEGFSIALRDLPIFAPIPFEERVAQSIGVLAELTLRLVVPPMLIAIVAAVGATMLDVGGFVFSLQSLTPNFSRFNPMEGLKTVFSLRSLIELIKSAIKAGIFFACVILVVRGYVNDMVWAPTCGLGCLIDVSATTILWILVIGCFLVILFAAIDYAIQRWLFTRDNRMTLTEVKREMRENYGDPHVRGERNAERKRIAQTAGLTGPNAANLWIAGPDGAIGITYKPERSGVPVVAAKAAGEAARGFLARAREAGIAVTEAPDVFGTLVAQGKVGQAIPRETFQRVAQLLVRAGFSG